MFLFFTFTLSNFLERTVQYLKQTFFAHENIKKNSKVAQNHPPSIAIRLKTSSTLNFCSIKIARRSTYNDFGKRRPPSPFPSGLRKDLSSQKVSHLASLWWSQNKANFITNPGGEQEPHFSSQSHIRTNMRDHEIGHKRMQTSLPILVLSKSPTSLLS